MGTQPRGHLGHRAWWGQGCGEGAKGGEKVCVLILLPKADGRVCLPTLHPKIAERGFFLILFTKIWIKGLSDSSVPKDWRKGLCPSSVPKDGERIAYALQLPDLDAFGFSFAFLPLLNPGGCRGRRNGFARLSL